MKQTHASVLGTLRRFSMFFGVYQKFPNIFGNLDFYLDGVFLLTTMPS